MEGKRLIKIMCSADILENANVIYEVHWKNEFSLIGAVTVSQMPAIILEDKGLKGNSYVC
jgi:hypothetical protein